MSTSQNGWPVFDSTDDLVKFTVSGVEFYAASHDVAYLGHDWISWFDKDIESLNLAVSVFPHHDDWSWSKRLVKGSSTIISNHASATAWDLNATRHPRGVKGTYGRVKRLKMRLRLRRYRDPLTGVSVLRLGEFYTHALVDGMHVEINADREAVARVVKMLKEKAVEAKDVWELDIVPNTNADGKPADPANKTWKPITVLSYMIRFMRDQRSFNARLDDRLDAIDERLARIPVAAPLPPKGNPVPPKDAA